MSRHSQLAVVKVGGSLLEWPELRPRLLQWLKPRREQQVVFIAGGGAMVNAIRRADAAHALGERLSHRLALMAMGATARLLADLMGLPLVASDQGVLRAAIDTSSESSPTPRHVVLDVSPAMIATMDDDAEPGPARTPGEALGALPHTWEVTSDSIAAAVAVDLGADELRLLKSVGPCVAKYSAQLENDDFPARWIDEHFASVIEHATATRVFVENLRQNAPR